MTDEDPPDHPDNQPKRIDQAEYISAVTEQIGSALKQLADDFSALKRDLPGNLSALNEQIQVNAEKQARDRKSYDEKQVFWTRWAAIGSTSVAAFTLVVLAATGYVAYQQKDITGGQLTVMTNQLNEMKTASSDTKAIADGTKAQAANTKILAETAKIQANAAIETAQAATKNIEVTQQNTILDQRAWVGPVLAQIVMMKENSLAKFRIEFRNAGRTPAVKFTNYVSIGAHRATDKFVPRYDVRSLSPQDSITVIQPGGVTAANLESSRPVSEVVLAAIKAGTVIYYVFGRLTYEDIFRQKRVTHFCFYVKTSLDGLASCNAYNDAN